jgi:hypothetical protein
MYPLFLGDRAKNDQLRMLSKFKVSRHPINTAEKRLRMHQIMKI